MEVRAERLLHAALVAARAHHGQLRKASDDPYILHPLRVARLVASLPDSTEEMVLAAVLHDVLEDTAVPAEELERDFGPQVLGLVRELTQEMSLPRVKRKQVMLERASLMSREAKIIKLADRLDNLTEAERMDDEFIQKYCAESQVLLARLKGACPEFEARIAELIDCYGS